MKIVVIAIAIILILLSYSVMYGDTKPTIAIMDLQCQGLSTMETILLTDRLLSEIGKVGTYDIVERAKRDEILKEQGFTLTGACGEASCLVEVGKYLAAQKMVGGSIGKFGEVWLINLRLVDVTSGKVDKTVDRDFTGSQGGLLLLMKEAAGELMGKDILLPEEKALLGKDRKDREALEAEMRNKKDEGQSEEERLKSEAEAKKQREADYQAQLLAKADEAARTARVKELSKQIELERNKREKEARKQAKIEVKARNKKLMAMGYIKPYRKTAKVLFWTSIGVGVGASVLKVFSEIEYKKYKDDTLKIDAINSMNMTKKLDTYTYITAGASGLCLLVSGVLYHAGNKKPLKLSLLPLGNDVVVLCADWRF
jgi:hypothetical protein